MNTNIKNISFTESKPNLMIKSISFKAPTPAYSEISDFDQFLEAIVEEMSADEDDYVV